MKQIFILFLLWFGLSLSAQDQISLLFVGDLMQHQAQIDAARQGDGYNYNDSVSYTHLTLPTILRV